MCLALAALTAEIVPQGRAAPDVKKANDRNQLARRREILFAVARIEKGLASLFDSRKPVTMFF